MGRLIGACACLLVAMGAPSASACNVPQLAVSTKSAGPGDWVNFSVTGTEPGARYTVYASGQDVVSAADPDGGGVADRFPMPDFGDARLPVTVELEVVHPDPGSAGGDYHGGAPWWGHSLQIRYRPVPGSDPRVEHTAPVPGEARAAPGRAARPQRARGERHAAPRRDGPAARRRGRPQAHRARARTRRRRAAARERDAGRQRRSPAARAERASGAGQTPARREAVREVAAAPGSEGKVGMKGAVVLLLALTALSPAYGRWRARRG